MVTSFLELSAANLLFDDHEINAIRDEIGAIWQEHSGTLTRRHSSTKVTAESQPSIAACGRALHADLETLEAVLKSYASTSTRQARRIAKRKET